MRGVFYIRTDANAAVATGHLMRCMAIGAALQKRGIAVVFIMAGRERESFVTGHGFEVICLDGKWNDMESELPALEGLIKTEPVQALLVDSYYVTKQYLETLGSLTKVAYLDDVGAFVYPVDLLVNYHHYHEKFHYEENYPKSTKLLLGSFYVPLREEFRNLGEPVLREVPKKLLVTTGGTDPCHVALEFLRYLYGNMKNDLPVKLRELEIYVVAGALNPDLEELVRLEIKHPKVFIRENVTRMSELMKECDLAVSAGGSTLYELCACGVPAVAFSFADNQLDGVKGFAAKGLIPYAGDVREGFGGMSAVLGEIAGQLARCLEDPVLRKTRSEAMYGCVSVDGADHIAGELERLV